VRSRAPLGDIGASCSRFTEPPRKKVRSAKFACCVPSQDCSPGYYRKDEHGQESESQRRCRHEISVAPHDYEEARNSCGAEGDDQGEQEAHADLFMPSISLLLSSATMRVRHRSTFRQ
jgi:hypothetical protein